MRQAIWILLLLGSQADALFGCSGRTSAAGSHGERTDSGADVGGGGGGAAGKPSKHAGAGVAQGGVQQVAAGGSAPSDAGSPDGGEQAGNAPPGGSGGGGAAAAGSAGVSGWAGSGGHSNGQYMCFDGVCGYQCEKDGVIGEPGWDFWVECNECHCNLNGFPDCEQKDCTKDCAWFADEYQAAWGEAQYCMLDDGSIDACARTQISSLSCACPSPVSSVVEFEVVSNEWAQRWAAAGCQRLPADECPPCKPGTGAHCDTEQGVCVYGK